MDELQRLVLRQTEAVDGLSYMMLGQTGLILVLLVLLVVRTR